MAPLLFLRFGFNPIGEEASLAILDAVEHVETLAFLGIENSCEGSADGDDSVQRVWEESRLFISELHRALTIEVEYPTRRRKFKFKKGTDDQLETTLIADEGEGHDAHPVSVFAVRCKECDSNSYWDTEVTYKKAFDCDWGYSKLDSFIADAQEREAVKEVLFEHYGILYEIFRCKSGQQGIVTGKLTTEL